MSPKSNKVQDRQKDNLAESEVQMMPGEENKEQDHPKGESDKEIKNKTHGNSEEHKDGDTDAKDKNEKKDEGDDLEEEEIY